MNCCPTSKVLKVNVVKGVLRVCMWKNGWAYTCHEYKSTSLGSELWSSLVRMVFCLQLLCAHLTWFLSVWIMAHIQHHSSHFSTKATTQNFQHECSNYRTRPVAISCIPTGLEAEPGSLWHGEWAGMVACPGSPGMPHCGSSTHLNKKCWEDIRNSMRIIIFL